MPFASASWRALPLEVTLKPTMIALVASEILARRVARRMEG